MKETWWVVIFDDGSYTKIPNWNMADFFKENMLHIQSVNKV